MAKVKTVEVEKSKKRVEFKISKIAYEVSMPDGYSFDDHQLLKRKNFANEILYWEHRAAESKWRMENHLAKAEDCRVNGSAADRRAKKQVVKLQSKMDELRKQLEGQGVDVDAILKAAVVAK